MPGADWTTISMKLKVWGQPLDLELPAPAGPVAPRAMLPVFQALTNAFVGAGVRKAESEGRQVSCRQGCAACCRQLIPISAMEAHQLRELIGDLEPAHRERVLARFESALERIEEAGLAGPMLAEDPGPVIELGLRFFDLRIDCPFLENEACSIHIVRPLACREYLVTSPPEECWTPNSDTVHMVNAPAYVSRAVRRLGAAPGDTARRWIPLVMALQWAETHEEDVTPAPGPEMLREVLERASGSKAKGTNQ